MKYNAYNQVTGTTGSKRYDRARASSQLAVSEMQNASNIVIEIQNATYKKKK